jgi:hypothetical protein
MIPISQKLFDNFHNYLTMRVTEYTTQARATMDTDSRTAERYVLLANELNRAGLEFNKLVRDEIALIEQVAAANLSGATSEH